MRITEVLDRLRVVKREMDRVRCSVVKHRHDEDEVAILKAVYDELLLERNLLDAELEAHMATMSDEQNEAAMEWAVRVSTHAWSRYR